MSKFISAAELIPRRTHYGSQRDPITDHDEALGSEPELQTPLPAGNRLLNCSSLSKKYQMLLHSLYGHLGHLVCSADRKLHSKCLGPVINPGLCSPQLIYSKEHASTSSALVPCRITKPYVEAPSKPRTELWAVFPLLVSDQRLKNSFFHGAVSSWMQNGS